MTSEQSFDDLVLKLQSGNQDAACEIFCRFSNRLIGLAQTRIGSRIRKKVDAEDVVQSAFKSFFHRQKSFSFDGWDSMWAMLVVITVRKCGRKVEAFHAACRDVRREVDPLVWSEESSGSWHAIAKDPTPAEAALLSDLIERLMQSCSDRDRQILTLALENWSTGEISEKVGRTERTVRRALHRFRIFIDKVADEDIDTEC